MTADRRDVTADEVVRRRLAATGLTGPLQEAPADVARRLLAVQSQDVLPSAWSLAQRCAVTEAVVERARAEGELLRTHVLRTTWHDVAAEDLRWLLRLTGPRVQAQVARPLRDEGVDVADLRRARRTFERALPGRHLTRAEAAEVLVFAGVTTSTRGLVFLLMHLELDGLLCSGVRRGKDQTYALLDERVPAAVELPHEQAVAALVLRFLTGHGPAAVKDITWWSSLLARDVRAALAELGDAVHRELVDDLELWSAVDAPATAGPGGVQLVQLYDELLVAFTASKHLHDSGRVSSAHALPHLAVVLEDGRVVGSWRRLVHRGEVVVETALLRPVDPQALSAAAQAYGRFLGLPARVRLVTDQLATGQF